MDDVSDWQSSNGTIFDHNLAKAWLFICGRSDLACKQTYSWFLSCIQVFFGGISWVFINIFQDILSLAVEKFGDVMDKIVAKQMIKSLHDESLRFRLFELKFANLAELTDRADNIVVARTACRSRSPPKVVTGGVFSPHGGTIQRGRIRSEVGHSNEVVRRMWDATRAVKLVVTVKSKWSAAESISAAAYPQPDHYVLNASRNSSPPLSWMGHISEL